MRRKGASPQQHPTSLPTKRARRWGMGLRTKWEAGDGGMGMERGGLGLLCPPQPGDPINPWGVGGTARSCPHPALSSPSCNPFQRGGLGGFRAGFESEMGCFQIILRQLCPLSLMQRGIKIDMKIIGGEEAPPPVGGPAPPHLPTRHHFSLLPHLSAHTKAPFPAPFP